MSDKKAPGTLFTPDDERAVRFLKEALEDPQGEVILCSFRPRENGSHDVNVHFKGSKTRGVGLIHTLVSLSIDFGQADVVLDFITKSRIVLDHAEGLIRSNIQRSATNN